MYSLRTLVELVKLLSNRENSEFLSNLKFSLSTTMRGQSIINIDPNSVKYVTQDEFERKALLYTAKYRRLVCVLISLLVLVLICFSISLSYAHYSPNAATDESGFGFSCVYQSTWETMGVIEYQRVEEENMPDNFDFQNGIFTAKVAGIYHVTYSFIEEWGINNTKYAKVSLLHNTKSINGANKGRSLYFKLDKWDTLRLECKICNNQNFIQNLYFCVALIQ